jgi:hypothetical protein
VTDLKLAMWGLWVAGGIAAAWVVASGTDCNQSHSQENFLMGLIVVSAALLGAAAFLTPRVRALGVLAGIGVFVAVAVGLVLVEVMVWVGSCSN